MPVTQLDQALAQSLTRPAHRSYYPALDGIRGLAFLAVFLHHYGYFPFGWMGVDCFFVLSGFLITGILYDTANRPDRVRSFYLRRTLRIFPLYYAIFVLLLLTAPFLHWRWNAQWLLWPAYLANWIPLVHHEPFNPGILAALNGYLEPGHGPRLQIGHFWSLCVEEQFYLIWPWFVFLIRDRRTLLRICFGVILLAPCLRQLALHALAPGRLSTGVIAHFTLFRLDTLLWGAAAALLIRGPHRDRLIAAARPFAWVAVLGSLALLLRTPWRLTEGPGYNLVLVAGFSLTGLFATALILRSLSPASRLVRPLTWAPLRWMGRVSYGAYVFHDIPHNVYQQWMHRDPLLTAVLGFVFTLALAWLSFRFLETPFLRLKDRLAPTVG